MDKKNRVGPRVWDERGSVNRRVATLVASLAIVIIGCASAPASRRTADMSAFESRLSAENVRWPGSS
jgi:hypothetical protein